MAANQAGGEVQGSQPGMRGGGSETHAYQSKHQVCTHCGARTAGQEGGECQGVQDVWPLRTVRRVLQSHT